MLTTVSLYYQIYIEIQLNWIAFCFIFVEKGKKELPYLLLIKSFLLDVSAGMVFILSRIVFEHHIDICCSFIHIYTL